MSPKRRIREKVERKNAAAAASIRELPAMRIRATPVPWNLSHVKMFMASYAERRISDDAPSVIDDATLDVSMKADLQWGDDGGLTVRLLARVTAVGTPYEVRVEVGHEAGLSRPMNCTDDELIELVRTVGLRVLFPYTRMTIATLTAQGSLGPLTLQPVYLELIRVEIPVR